MAHEIDTVLARSLGHFWPQTERDGATLDIDAIAGTISKRDDGSLELAGLYTDPGLPLSGSRGTRTTPSYVLGATDNGGVLLSGVSQRRSSATLGGSKAATTHFEAQSLVVNVPIQLVENGLVNSLSGHWHGVGRWAGVETTKESSETDDSGRLKSLTLHLAQLEPVSIEIDGDCTVLELGSTWSVSGPEDSRLVSAPLTFTVKRSEPFAIEDEIQTLMHVQDLINLAFGGFVKASTGAVYLCESEDGGRSATKRREIWNRHLMERPSGVREPKSMNEVPFFYFGDVGGLDGIRRWIVLNREHPRLLRPILTPHRVGPSVAETVLVEIGTAIDYWHGANVRKRPWADESLQPLAVANSVGSQFGEWAGDLRKWSEHYWYHYNGLKHFIPKYHYDATAVHWLALSGLGLMTCVALDEISDGQQHASTRVLTGHRWNGLSREVRGWLDSVADHPASAA